MSRTRTKGWVAALAATTLAAAGAMFALAGTASAEPTIPDPTRQGSLTIHKIAGAPESPQRNNGTLLDPPPAGDPLPGVGFTIQQITDIDLSTNEGWQDAADIPFDPADPVGSLTGYTLGTARSDTTSDPEGTITFDNLEIGLYLVTESSPLPGYTAAAPFLVTIPITNPTGDDWIYDVHVYPKNIETTAEKDTVDADSYKVGDQVQWVITGSVGGSQTGPGGAYEIDSYILIDPIHENLRFDGVESITVNTTPSVDLLPGDFTVTLHDTWADTGAQGDHTATYPTSTYVKIEITAQGRGKLTEASPMGTVTFVLNTTVLVAGEIEDEAVLFPNKEAWETEDGGTPTNPSDTKFGGITIDKHDSTDSTKKLTGAIFSVIAVQGASAATDAVCATAYNAGASAYSVVSLPDTATAADLAEFGSATRSETRTGGEPNPFGADALEWTTNAGTAVVNGLRYSAFANNGDVAPGDAEYVLYCLVEIQSPDGYALMASPKAFQVTGQTSAITFDVANVKNNGGFELPFTGASGVRMLVTMGTLLAVAGLVLIVVVRRRDRGAANSAL